MAIKKKKKTLTLSDLALSMNQGFKRADDKMEQGFKRADDKMEQGFKRADDKMEQGFKRADEKLASAIEGLAQIVGKGFEQVDKRFEQIEGKVNDLSITNTREHEEIKMRLDNVAYRFELVALEKRVERLERIDRVNTSKLPK